MRQDHPFLPDHSSFSHKGYSYVDIHSIFAQVVPLRICLHQISSDLTTPFWRMDMTVYRAFSVSLDLLSLSVVVGEYESDYCSHHEFVLSLFRNLKL